MNKSIQPKYSVVHWYNYRKELNAGFCKYFENFEDADKYAFNLALNDTCNLPDELNGIEYTVPTSELPTESQQLITEISEKYEESYYIITEDEITDNNGPGYGPYNCIKSYGNSKDGYATTFYCVVESFPGVENSWDDFVYEDYEHENWVPKYYY
jgi:hypothetical protein